MRTENIPTDEKLQDTYIKIYRMQATGAGGETIRTSVPREIVEREARSRGLTVKEFVKQFKVCWLFNGFEGAWARFVKKENKEEQ